jgi:hypothetical protein
MNSKSNVVAARRFLATLIEDKSNLRIRYKKEGEETQPGWKEFCPHYRFVIRIRI